MPNEILRTFRDGLRDFVAGIPEDVGDLTGVNSRRLRALRDEVSDTIGALEQLLIRMDTVEHPGAPFDPGSPSVAARTIADALLRSERVALSGLRPFYGSGVYALYYRGDHPAYERISDTDIPIYIGKANPKNAHAQTPVQQGQALFVRLSDHAASITEAENAPEHTLTLDDFDARYLVLGSAWQGVSEAHLIRHFKPIWNKEMKVCQGLGKHGDSSTTRDNRRSRWDTLHPGRAWAANASPNKLTAEQIVEVVRQYAEEAYRDFEYG